MIPHVILVVEDDDDIRELVVELLRSQGCAVREASDGRRALEVLDEIGDDACLVLTDWEMPRMDGQELLARLRAHQKLATLPVVIATGASLEHPERRVLRKPVSDEVLLRVIDEYCHQIV
jgi:CheY-like chemotaxis protein